MSDSTQGIIRCLLVQSKFSDFSFWNYQDICKIVGRKYPAAPLGLLTVAALLPQHWEFRLIDENVEPLYDEHILWADLVCTGGMLPQQRSILSLIDRVHTLGRFVVVGGPDPSSQPDLYNEADYLVMGEGEITIPMFLEDLAKGIKKGKYCSTERAEMLNAVVPRYDLIRFNNYIMIGLQFIRGCPFNCEFCDVIELYGRIPRYKSNEQVLREMQTLYDLGYRGHIDIVDDNFIGNKKKVKALLRDIKAWTEARKYPFFFTTEASVNLADDEELLQLMKDVDFRYIFLGIETPDNETLSANQKNQNVDKSIHDTVKKLLSYGIVSNGGYIIGFDSESNHVADQMITSIQDSGICMAMIGLLYALPNTQLTRRLEAEGRLFHRSSKTVGVGDIDQATSGLNFLTNAPRTTILGNYSRVLEAIFNPKNYYKRVIYTGLNINAHYKHTPGFFTWLVYLRSFFRVCWHAGFSSATGYFYWKMFFTVLFRNPRGIEPAVNLAAMYIHFKKQKDYIVKLVGDNISSLEKTGENAFNEMMLKKSGF